MTKDSTDRPVSPDPRVIAASLRLAGTIMVCRDPDGRMVATGGGRAGYGTDRDAAIWDLALQLERYGPSTDN